MPKDARQILKEKAQGLSDRANFDTYWQTCHDFYDIEHDDVNQQYSAGTELTVTQLFDTYSLEAADVLASGLMNYMTPPASKWFGFTTKNKGLMESKKVAHYLKDVEAEVNHALNNSNFYDVKPDFYKKSGVYGTSILFQEDDPFDDVRFYSIPVKNCVIVEDARQRVVEYYIEFEYTATQAVTRFGDKTHPSMIKEHKENRESNKKYKFTLYIGPNWDRNPQAIDTKNKPWTAKWVDDEHITIIDEGGFDELPAMCHRFYKRANIVWGFSPAMKALSDVRVLNAMAKTQLRAAMKATDPAVAMPDNAFLMPFNYNPRGTNYYRKGSLSRDDVFTVGNDGNPMIGMEMMEYRMQRIRSQMFTDVFLAFQNVTKQMNNPEVFERIAEKMTLLGPAVGRYMSAVLDPTLTRTMSILDRKGRLPEPPQELVDDPQFEIEYLSTLAKAQRNSELQSLQNALLMVGQMAQFSPDVLDKVDADRGVDVVFDVTGAPVQMLRDDVEVGDIRDRRAEAEAQEQEMAMLQAGAGIAKDATMASKTARDAQLGAAPGIGI